MPDIIHDHKGEVVLLNSKEQFIANVLQRKFNDELMNALEYEINITTLTQILKGITRQSFMEIPVADYLPVVVGEGAWSSNLLKYRDFSVADDFETGMLNTGSDHSRLAEVSSAVDAVTTPVFNWAKQISWSLMDLKIAARSGSWDIVESKERSRKMNWDLGIQRTAFYGSLSNPRIQGLLTMSGVTSNTTVITKSISSMTAAEFKTFLSTVYEAYRLNVKRTARPTHFFIPEDDYNGLGSAADETFPMLSKLERIQNVLRTLTANPNFKVLPLPYGAQSFNAAIPGLNKNRYVMLNYNSDSIRMDIPVDYTNTIQNTINGFHFQNVGYGQFTGVQNYKPLETLYFDYAV